LSYDDALNNRNQKTNYDLVDGSQFYVRLDYQTCTNVLGPVMVKFNPTPIVTSPVDIEVKMCDSNDDGIENFNWADLVKNKVTMDAGVSLIRVFSSYDNAYNASPYSSGMTTIRDGQYKVYARVESLSFITPKITFILISATEKQPPGYSTLAYTLYCPSLIVVMPLL
jgi:hypothetical protein